MRDDVQAFAALFNAGRYHAAHDALEPRWTVSRSHTLQGLIQLAVGWHHLSRGNAHGARALWTRALAHLEQTAGEPDEGVDIAPIRAHLIAALAALPRSDRLDGPFPVTPPRLDPAPHDASKDTTKEPLMNPTTDTRLNDVLHELEAMKSTRDDLWNVSWDSARFLRILVLSTGARNVLEIGMSNGFSTLWLADAARANGGRVTSLEVEPYKVEMATESFRKAGLDGTIDVRLGDGRETLSSLPGPYDFVFIDAWKGDYLAYLRAVTPLLKPGGLIAADNAVSHAEEMKDFLDAVRNEGAYDSVLVPIGNGIELARKR